MGDDAPRTASVRRRAATGTPSRCAGPRCSPGARRRDRPAQHRADLGRLPRRRRALRGAGAEPHLRRRPTAASATRRPGGSRSGKGYDGKYPALGWDPEQTWTGYIPFDALPYVENPRRRLGRHREPGVDLQGATRTSSPTTGRTARAASASSTSSPSRPPAADVMTADKMREIQFDTWNENAAFLVPKIKGAAVSGSAVEAVTLLDGWDFRQPSDSAPAAYFNVFWKNLLLDTFGDAAARRLPARRRRPLVHRRAQPLGQPRGRVVGRRAHATRPRVATTPCVKALEEAADEMVGAPGLRPGRVAVGRRCTRCSWRTRPSAQSGITPVEAIFNRGPIDDLRRRLDRQRDRLDACRTATRSTGCRRCAWCSTSPTSTARPG